MKIKKIEFGNKVKNTSNGQYNEHVRKTYRYTKEVNINQLVYPKWQ